MEKDEAPAKGKSLTHTIKKRSIKGRLPPFTISPPPVSEWQREEENGDTIDPERAVHSNPDK
jgi:hypothetical protein